jgi:hypothetical protein
LLYDSATGTGRPLSIAYIESEGTTIASVVKFYSDSVNGVAGNWGTIIPNHNANGVQRLEQRSLLADSLISTFTSSTGIWGDGVSTVNPTGGLTPIRFDTAQVKPTLISGSGTGQAKTFVLEQNYPNPFNPTTVIQFSVPKASVVKLRVFNALGQQVRLLFDGIANAGQTYSISLNARGLSSGIYYYSLITNATTLTRKMILLQ